MKTVVVTGATSGIGFAVCEALAANGVNIIGVGRSAENCRAAREKLSGTYTGGSHVFFHGDLMQQAEVRRISGEIRERLDQNGGELNGLVNNAGCVRSWYMTTQEGYEQQFALNHLAGFLLTNELMPYLIRAQGRVLFTSSGSHKGIKLKWDDLMHQRRYNPLSAYKRSKLCNVLTAYAINERFSEQGVSAYAVDPGLVATDIGNKDTGKLVSVIWRWRKSCGVDPAIPAQTYLRLFSAPGRPEGIYQGLKGAKRFSDEVTGENAARLYEISKRLCGIETEEGLR